MASGNKKRRGPKGKRLVIQRNWKSAIGKALKKKRPPKSWPKSDESESGD